MTHSHAIVLRPRNWTQVARGLAIIAKLKTSFTLLGCHRNQTGSDRLDCLSPEFSLLQLWSNQVSFLSSAKFGGTGYIGIVWFLENSGRRPSNAPFFVQFLWQPSCTKLVFSLLDKGAIFSVGNVAFYFIVYWPLSTFFSACAKITDVIHY